MWRREIQRHSGTDSLSFTTAIGKCIDIVYSAPIHIADSICSSAIVRAATTMALAVMGSTAGMAAATSKTSTSTTIAALNLATPFSGGSFRSSAKTTKTGSRSTGLRVQCMQVWEPYNNKRWETLSYLPTLTPEQILKQIDYLIRSNWVPCLEFDEDGYIKREGHKSPGYYDGRYWTMWKLPMFGCKDSTQVMSEISEVTKAYPKAFVRVIGFDSIRQVQCISFIVHKP